MPTPYQFIVFVPLSSVVSLFNVVERDPRPLGSDTSLHVNRGGVAIVAADGIRLTPVDVGQSPSTFECVAARITSGQSSCVVIVIYRTGNVTTEFFRELSSLLERLVTLADALLLVGNVNIRLERTSDPDAIQFIETLSSVSHTILEVHSTLYVHETTWHIQLSTSSTSASPITVCCSVN